MNSRLVLGTRGSALALAQVELVKSALAKAHPELRIEVKTITTSGDRSQQAAQSVASGAGLKGMFTREIEEALLAGEIDAAVHSCKDLPGKLADGCAITAVLERAATDDVLILKNASGLSDLPSGARIATSSVRRRRQLRWMRGDLVIEEMRGNVPTRLRKLRESDALAGIVLARAGLERLGYVLGRTTEFEGGKFWIQFLETLPAIGQGAIALASRTDDAEITALLSAINHAPTLLCIRAERELLRLLDGDCDLPVGAKSELRDGRLHMRAIVFGEESEPPRAGEAEGPDSAPEEVARAVFERLANLRLG